MLGDGIIFVQLFLYTLRIFKIYKVSIKIDTSDKICFKF